MSSANSQSETEAALNSLQTTEPTIRNYLNPDEGWEVSVSRSPFKERASVTLSADVGVLTYHVRVVPEENAPSANGGSPTFHGYRIERFHSATPADGEATVDQGVVGQQDALDIAEEEMKRLTA